MSLEKKIDKVLNCTFLALRVAYGASSLYFLYDVLFNQDSIEAKAGKIIYSAVSGVMSYHLTKDCFVGAPAGAHARSLDSDIKTLKTNENIQ